MADLGPEGRNGSYTSIAMKKSMDERSQSVRDMRVLSEADGVINIKNILRAKRDGLHRSVRMPVTEEGFIEKWVFCDKIAEHKMVHVDDLERELLSHEASWIDEVKTEEVVANGYHSPDREDSKPASRPASNGPSVSDSKKHMTTWYHVCGSDENTVKIFGNHFDFRTEDVHAASIPAVNGPEVEFVRGDTRDTDYMFIICHELRLAHGENGSRGNENSAEFSSINSVRGPSPTLSRAGSRKWNLALKDSFTERKTGKKERALQRDSIWAASRELELEEVQVCIFLIPERQVVVSVGLSSTKSPILEAARENLENSRSAVRRDCSKGDGATTLIVVILDALMDTILPTLDLYGDVLEGVGLLMNANPDHSYVRLTAKLKNRLNQIRRYTWDARGIFLELQQDMHGVMNMTTRVQTLIHSTAQIETESEAYLAACGGIETFYNTFQQGKMNSTLFTLTTATISIMPIQLLTGVWGMNFENMPELSWEYGYVMFWTLACCILLLAFIYVGNAHMQSRRGTVILHKD